jgi:hypothetical protein
MRDRGIFRNYFGVFATMTRASWRWHTLARDPSANGGRKQLRALARRMLRWEA